MASSSSTTEGGLRFFSGETEDGREYKRWKQWVKNKLLTLDKLAEGFRGAYIYTLLSGKALEAVEHVDPETYQKKGGDDVLWGILDRRFPQQETVDELGEILTEVFSLRSNEGENMKQWSARASEIFDRCQRKTGVSFPEEARGWLLLHRSGLTDEMKAVVIARARGDLKRESISAALRSCYPEMVVTRKRVGVALAEPFEETQEEFGERVDDSFSDVEQLIEEHQPTTDYAYAGEEDPFPESEVAEVLAATWKEKRQELNRLQKTRQFQKAKDVRRSFRVEIEEMKRNSTCNKCGRRGHWARECRSKDNKGASKGRGTSSTSAPSGAAAVHELDFVASILDTPSVLDKLRARRLQATLTPPLEQTEELLLVSSPGFGVLDSGCGRTIIGAETLKAFKRLWIQRGWVPPQPFHEVHQFKFGNGEVETSTLSIQLPVVLAQRQGVIRAAIIRGDAPLLLSRSAMKALGATLDFKNDCLQVFDRSVKLQTNSAGQYVVQLLGDEKDSSAAAFTEVMASTEMHPPKVEEELDRSSDSCETMAQTDSHASADAPAEQPPETAVWTQENCDVISTPWLSREGPSWKHVFRRVTDMQTHRVLDDSSFDPGTPQKKTIVTLLRRAAHVKTEFFYVGSPLESPNTWCPSHHQCRQLHKQAQTCLAIQERRASSSCLVMEVFSPPRFAVEAERAGYRAKSYDLVNGFDFRRASDRKLVENELVTERPELLVLCPPCTDEGGWFHLNSHKWDPWEVLRRKAQSRRYITWCCKLFRMQMELGGRAVFEHPTGSRLWSYAEMQSLCRKYTTVKLHMCRFGLKLPSSEKFIRKSTRLLVSHEDMSSLGLMCTHEGKHQCHDVVAGHAPDGTSISKYAGQYPRQFVHAVLNTVPKFQAQSEVLIVTPEAQEECVLLEVIEDGAPASLWDEVYAAGHESAKTDAELLPVLAKLHRNLGHPPNCDLVRILKHGQASDQALRLAKEFSCDFCKSQARPKIPLPAQPNRVAEFNQQIAIDVKHLRGWKPNQKVKALNVVDTASGFQRMIPFFQVETAHLLRELLNEHWISWAGVPREIILDPARTNLGAPMTVPAELEGTHVRPIAAGAHWQLGKCESHGGWFNRVLEKLIDDYIPQDQKGWLECVTHAHIKNQMLQVHGLSPCQFVFGRNPHIPQDLLNEPLSIVPATASITEEAIAKTQAMRTTARRTLIEMQDDRALRVALLARPRRPMSFKAGDLVAYWRNQKWVQGQLQTGGQWYGVAVVAVVLGTVGRNLVLIHRRQVIRCAPEQVRPATNEEKCLVATPEAELLGIKDLIESGNLRSRQYLDLLPQAYPPQEGDVPPPESDAVNPAPPSEQSQPEQADLRTEPCPRDLDSEKREITESRVVEPPAERMMPDELVNEDVETTVDKSPMPPQDSGQSQTYGPVRRRVSGKDGPMSLWRPPAMRQDDFVEIMKEVVPQLLEDVCMNSSSASSKRSLSPDAGSQDEPAASRQRVDEVLCVQDCQELTALAEQGSWDCLMAEYMKKKMSKELHHSNNPPALQQKVQEGKRTEWETIAAKPNSVRVHYGKKAEYIKQQFADRFIGSRYVLTRKPIEEGMAIDPDDYNTFTVKGRWCLQGHLDPDLETKAERGMLKSPTLSQLGRMTLMQVIASKGWLLQLGDIKGAFLEAGPLSDEFRPLYARQPAGGIPGIPENAVIEILGNLYGQNDAPAAWFREFSTQVRSLGWHQSVLDPCMFTLRDPKDDSLCGVMGVHVDDTAVGGSGELFERSIKALRKRFPYRKWRTKTGEFCGAWYEQRDDYTIHMHMSSFAEKIRPINIPKNSSPQDVLTPSQIKILRAVNGSLN